MDQTLKSRPLAPFFTPRSVAIVGASGRATSAGGAVFHMMRKAGFAGTLIPVNPKGGALHGLPVARSLDALAEPADLVVIAIRPDFIVDAVREAAATGHRAVLILPGGFSEAGEEGRRREAALEAVAKEAGMTIAGPNCGGIINIQGDARLAATFFRDLPPGGPIAFVSQSGALAEEVIAHAQAHHIPIGTIVSVGNSLHLGVEDHLAFLAADDGINCILLYLESARDLEALGARAREVSRQKPIVALIPGRTGPGLAAARAHTGASLENDAAIDRLCAEAGIVRAASLRELELAAKAFGFFPQGVGRRALILSNSGGPGVLATDRATLVGLDLVDLPPAMAEALRGFLPGEASVRNPLDLLADAREDRFGATLDAALARADAFDVILMIHVVPFMVDAAPVIDALAARAQGAGLPILHSMMGTLVDKAAWFRRMEDAGVPVFDNIEDMAVAAGILARYDAIRRQGDRG
ncbi:MAG: CoA-binding protein [Rhodothalassiaceae bacterium]